MSKTSQTDEIRWQVIKAMLEEFPTLKERVKNYLKEQKHS
jgi:pyrroloquinoline quinone (PQQ) biosynthesis protein C